jgi:hypothetical protein
VRRLVLALTFLATYAAVRGVAQGNGRFPKAQAMVGVPGARDEANRALFLRATFGVLVSRDGGRHWRWLCEQAYGSVSTWDPPIATTKDGRLWIGMPSGARVTQDGCAVADVAELRGETVTDFAEAAGGARLYAATSTEGKPSRVFAQRADGSWEGRGSIQDLRVDTMDVAPSNASRLYVTGVRQGLGQSTRESLFYRSDDGGRTFVAVKPTLPVSGRLFLAAIDPRSEARILARILHDAGSELVVSTDAGASFRVVLHMNGAMFGFAKSDDGQTYWAGSGNPKEGIWRSRDRGEHWDAMARSGVFCLLADGDELYACSNPYVPGGYAVAVSKDGGRTLDALATFASIEGAVECDGGAGAACAPAWPATRDAIAASGAELTRKPSRSSSDLADAPAPASAPAPAPAPAKRGCGCSTVGVRQARQDLRVELAILAMVALGRSRRRRRVDLRGLARLDRERTRNPPSRFRPVRLFSPRRPRGAGFPWACRPLDR